MTVIYNVHKRHIGRFSHQLVIYLAFFRKDETQEQEIKLEPADIERQLTAYNSLRMRPSIDVSSYSKNEYGKPTVPSFEINDGGYDNQALQVVERL